MGTIHIYVETDDAMGLHYVCIGTVESDDDPFVIWSGKDESAARAHAQILANKLRSTGATVQLH